MKNLILIFLLLIQLPLLAQKPSELDKKVEAYLKAHKEKWHDLNVPYEDGQLLHDIIVKNGYTAALEIGTSTGHSTIWLAWAMSKTGGKIITLELDEGRRKEALKNLQEAGLSAYVDSRLGNAHDIVKQLTGPFDFVFSDADKGWYKQYFSDIHPKLKPGGCYTTHNVRDGLAGDEYLEFVMNHPDYNTTVDKTSRAGVMIAYRKK